MGSKHQQEMQTRMSVDSEMWKCWRTVYTYWSYMKMVSTVLAVLSRVGIFIRDIDAWAYSADLLQHVKSAALLAGDHFPKWQAEDLRKTTNFVEYHSLRVWVVMTERRRRRN
jgi:hypothetical protein